MGKSVKEGNNNPLLIFYDIETNEHGIPIENDYGYLVKNPDSIISCICAITENGDEYTDYIKCRSKNSNKLNSNKLINRFRKWCNKISDNNYVLVGYNNFDFDNINIFARKYDTLDIMKLAYDNGYTDNLKTSLNEVAKKYLDNEVKTELDPVLAWYNHEYESLAEYCLQDVKLTKQLFDYFDFKPLIESISEISGCSFSETQSKLSIANASIPGDNSIDCVIENEGALNFIGNRSLHDKNFNVTGKFCYYIPDMLHIDISSMYPNIMRMIKINADFSYPDIQVTDLYENDEVVNNRTGLPVKFIDIHIDKFNVLPEAPDEIGEAVIRFMEERTYNKQLYRETGDEKYNIRQQALKICANSIYGNLKHNNFNKVTEHLAATVTYIGREILSGVGRHFEAEFGKTDSLWIPSKYTVEEVNQYTREFIRERFGLTTDLIQWEAENNGRIIDLYITGKNDYLEVYQGEIITAKGKMKLSNKKPVVLERLTYDLILNDIDEEEGFTWESYVNDLINEYPYAYQWGSILKFSSAWSNQLRFNREYLNCIDSKILPDYAYRITGTSIGYIALPQYNKPEILVGEWFAYKVIQSFINKFDTSIKIYKEDLNKYNNIIPKNYEEIIQNTWKVKEIPSNIDLTKFYWKDIPLNESIIFIGENDNSQSFYYYENNLKELIKIRKGNSILDYQGNWKTEGFIDGNTIKKLPAMNTGSTVWNKKYLKNDKKNKGV